LCPQCFSRRWTSFACSRMRSLPQTISRCCRGECEISRCHHDRLLCVHGAARVRSLSPRPPRLSRTPTVATLNRHQGWPFAAACIRRQFAADSARQPTSGRAPTSARHFPSRSYGGSGGTQPPDSSSPPVNAPAALPPSMASTPSRPPPPRARCPRDGPTLRPGWRRATQSRLRAGRRRMQRRFPGPRWPLALHCRIPKAR
jgi:hypothetical protein